MPIEGLEYETNEWDGYGVMVQNGGGGGTVVKKKLTPAEEAQIAQTQAETQAMYAAQQKIVDDRMKAGAAAYSAAENALKAAKTDQEKRAAQLALATAVESQLYSNVKAIPLDTARKIVAVQDASAVPLTPAQAKEKIASGEVAIVPGTTVVATGGPADFWAWLQAQWNNFTKALGFKGIGSEYETNEWDGMISELSEGSLSQQAIPDAPRRTRIVFPKPPR